MPSSVPLTPGLWLVSDLSTRAIITQYARRMTIEQRLAEIIRAFCADALSSTVNLNVDLDVMLAVLAQALTAALRTRLPGYATVTPDTIQRRFLEPPARSSPTATRSPSASNDAHSHPSSGQQTCHPPPPSPGGEAHLLARLVFAPGPGRPGARLSWLARSGRAAAGPAGTAEARGGTAQGGGGTGGSASSQGGAGGTVTVNLSPHASAPSQPSQGGGTSHGGAEAYINITSPGGGTATVDVKGADASVSWLR